MLWAGQTAVALCVCVLAEEVRLDCEGVIEDIEYP